MDYPLEKLFGCCFHWVLIRHPIFAKLGILRVTKNGAKKVKKRNVLAKERNTKGENDFEHFSPQTTSSWAQ